MNRPMLGYGRQSISEDDIRAVVAVLRGDYLTQGPAVDRFESALAEYVGARHAVAVANGTAALHIACMAAGLVAGQRAVTQAVTFVATANAVRHCGATVGMVDIDRDSLGIDVTSLRTELEQHPETTVVLPVHMAGYSANPSAIRAQVKTRLIIEDACHALGGREPDGAMVGGCRHSDMACFSFHPVKSITTAEGGAVTTNDPELAHLLRMLRNHGLERDPRRFQIPAEGTEGSETNPWYYEQQLAGFNYRLTDVQAALGLSQLARIESFLRRRQEIAAAYDDAFGNLTQLRPLQANEDARKRSALHLYLLHIDFAAIGKSRRKVMSELRAKGIGTQVHYIPVYRQPFHGGARPRIDHFPNSEWYYRGCLSIPMHPVLTDEDVEYVVGGIREVCGC